MQIYMEVNLKELRNETLYELINGIVYVLKERSNATHSNELLDNSSDDHSNATKENKTIKKKPYKKRQAKDFTELDKIVKKYYGKKSLKEMIAIAAEKGITTDSKQIDYRRKKLGITPLRNFGRPKKTDKAYLKSIEERDNLDLEGTENPKNLNEPEEDDK